VRIRYRYLVVAAVAVTAAGVASGKSASHPPRSDAANRRVARHDAVGLLGKLVLPDGATRVSSDPSIGRRLNAAALVEASPQLVDLHRFWRVAESPADVLAWLHKHVPSGSVVGGTGTSSGPGFSIDSIQFGFRAVSRVLLWRDLVVSVAAARGRGAAIRADAEDVWVLERPRSERVPSGTAQIDVAVTRTDFKTGHTSTTPQTVTKAATIQKVISLVDALPMDQLGAVPCPVDLGPDVTLKFLPASGSTPLAVATAQGEGCGLVSFTVESKAEPDLADGGTLVERLGRLLGFKTDFPRPLGDLIDAR
jgi:hypothetical protein